MSHAYYPTFELHGVLWLHLITFIFIEIKIIGLFLSPLLPDLGFQLEVYAKMWRII